MQRPATITENGYVATFGYADSGERVKMLLTHNGTTQLTRYYLGGQYELDSETSTERLYLGGDAYSAPAVYVKEAGNWNIYYICRDYQGSITHIVNANGSLKQELSYDPWGRLRDPNTQQVYAVGAEPTLFLARGYTGHEHLTVFGLINMNARLYDPALGRFLSPDPYVQSPDLSQNYNRYSYCLNNPLKYNDPSGEIIGTILTSIFETFANLFNHGVNFNEYTYEKTSSAWEIDKGLFTGNFGQIVLKWTWGLPNTMIGNLAGHFLNIIGVVDNVTHLDGAVALSNVTRKGSAFTIGNYVFGPENFTADWRDHTFVHEYGHYIQSNWFGPFYLPVVASTSLLSAAGLGEPMHQDRWFEVQASRMGADYFDKKYGSGKDGYVASSSGYFDKNAFINGGYTPYINPRTGSKYQYPHPTSGAQFSIWDVIVPIVTLGTLGLIIF